MIQERFKRPDKNAVEKLSLFVEPEGVTMEHLGQTTRKAGSEFDKC